MEEAANPNCSDFLEHTLVTAPSLAQRPSAQTVTDADEASLVGIVRILNQVNKRGMLSPVERAFIMGAEAMFSELTAICKKILASPPATESSGSRKPPAPMQLKG